MKKTIILAVILALVAGGFIYNSVAASKAPKISKAKTSSDEMGVSCQLVFTTLRWYMLNPIQNPNSNPYAIIDYPIGLGNGDSATTGDGVVNLIDLAYFASHKNNSEYQNWCDNQLKWPASQIN
jgi:hypothetical protein